MKLRSFCLSLSLLLSVGLTQSQAVVLGSLGNGTTDDGDNEHFVFVSTNSYTPGTDETVDSWSVEIEASNIGGGESVVPLIYTSTGGDSGPFTIVESGPARTSSGTSAWGATLTGGTEYFFGFSQDTNAVQYGGAGGGGTNPILMTDAWVNGTNSNPPALGASAPTSSGDHWGGTAYGYFNEGALGDRNYNISFSTTPIPEPSSALLLLLGFGLAARRRR